MSLTSSFLGENRIYGSRQLLSVLLRNGWVLCQALIIGDCGLDPDQDAVYSFTWRDVWTIAVTLTMVTSGWWFYWSWRWLLLCFVLPVAWTLLGDCRGAQRFWVRVWLPRWYLVPLVIGGFWSRAPLWIKATLALWWAFRSWWLSCFYGSDLMFYQQVEKENHNRNRYRIAALPYIYMREGQLWRAEEETFKVLVRDPENEKCRLLVSLMQMNLKWILSGAIPVGFRCGDCQGQWAELLKDGSRLTRAAHDMYFLRICPNCLRCGGEVEML